MPHYLVQAAYTPETWAALTKNPHDRTEVVGRAIESMGGRYVASYLAFGEYDVVSIVEFPDNVTAAAFSVAASAAGGLKAIKTTPLLTWEEGVQAMSKGGSIEFPVPG